MFTSGNQIGTCGNLDIQCICSNSSFLSSIACCLASACDAADQQAAVAYAKQICTTAGVTVPNAVSCVSSSTTATATSAVSSAGSPTGPSTGTSVASSTSTAEASATSASATSASATSASATKNAGIQNAAGAGMSFAGGLAAVFALL
jgi:cobalamin biosynthesis Mg chelatase CobN